MTELKDDVDTLLSWLGKECRIPKYEKFLFALDGDFYFDHESQYQKIDQNKVYEIGDFGGIYKDKKQSGYSWINLQCAGLYENALFFIVECPGVSVGSEHTSVNFSGPFSSIGAPGVEWDLGKKIEIT